MATLPKKPPASPTKAKAKDPAQRAGKLKKVPPTGMNLAMKEKPKDYTAATDTAARGYAKGGMMKKGKK